MQPSVHLSYPPDALAVSDSPAVYPWITLTVALLYGGVLAALPLEAFQDRANYLVYARSSWSIFRGYWESGFLTTLANEPLWLLMNATIGTWLSPEIVVRLIIFIPATIVAWLVLRYDQSQFVWLLLILLIPQVIKNHIIHLRQGAAIALFVAGWMTNRHSLKATLMLAAPLMHASFFFILAVMVLERLMRLLLLAADLRSLLFVGSGISVGLGLGWIASLLGARQVGWYNFSAAEVSGLGFVFWAVVFLVWCFEGRDFLRRNAVASGVILFYLGTYFLVEVAARIFESGLLLVLLAGLQLTGWRRQAFLVLLLAYGTMQWLTRIGYPWLGFGVG